MRPSWFADLAGYPKPGYYPCGEGIDRSPSELVKVESAMSATAERVAVHHCPDCEVEWSAPDPLCWSCGRPGAHGRLPDLAQIAAYEVGWWAPARAVIDHHRCRAGTLRSGEEQRSRSPWWQSTELC